MARIAGVDLPREKRIEIGLTYIYGIGRSSADKILAQADEKAAQETDKLKKDALSKADDAVGQVIRALLS